MNPLTPGRSASLEVVAFAVAWVRAGLAAPLPGVEPLAQLTADIISAYVSNRFAPPGM